MDDIQDLIRLYSMSSKHSSYQCLPSELISLFGSTKLIINSRFENERVKYILRNIDIKSKNILDIGANTGFFSFEFLKEGAEHFTAYEGNKAHADFLACATNVLGRQKQVDIFNEYFLFDSPIFEKKYDITLLLNVLHHIGDDFGDKDISINSVKKLIIKSLNSLANITTYLVFQLGFNWKGNRDNRLFEAGTKREMIDFIRDGTYQNWSIDKIGVAERLGDTVTYNDLNDNNIKREDPLGEFLNRPIFILKSKKGFNYDF
jgi:SAM-dependent methyltransferase